MLRCRYCHAVHTHIIIVLIRKFSYADPSVVLRPAAACLVVAMSDGGAYTVPLVCADLRREETIQQVCDALAHLDAVSNDVFSRIARRIDDNHARLRAINARVALAHARVERVKCSKKATQVFSAAKFPAATQVDYAALQTGGDAHGSVRRRSYRLHAAHQKVDDTVLKEKLQFYSVPMKTRKERAGSHNEGLGGLPANVASIGSLLLFNTSENP